MAEIGHAYVSQTGLVTSNSTSWTTPTNFEITGGSLTGSKNYILIANALVGGKAAGQNDFMFQLLENGVGQLAGSEARLEPRRTADNSGQLYFFVDKVATASTPNDYEFQFKRAASGSQNAKINDFQILMLNLDDITTSDWKFDEDNTNLDSLSSSAWTDGAEITAGDGSSDWLIAYSAHVNVDTVGASIRCALNVDGSSLDHIDLESEDVEEQMVIGGFAYLDGISSSAIKLQFQTDSGTAGQMDVDRSAIFALRLDKFEDHFGERDTTDVPVTGSGSTTTVGSTAHTTDTAAARDWCFLGYTLSDTGDNQKRLHRQLQSGATGVIVGDLTDHVVMAGNSDNVSMPLIGEETDVDDDTSITLNYQVQEESDVSPNPVFIDTHLIGFTFELGYTPVTVSGAGAIAGIIATVAGVSERVITGAASLAAALATGAGVSEIVRKATGAVSVSRSTVSGVSERTIKVTSSPSGTTVTISGAAEREVKGTGSPSGTTVTLSGALEREVKGTGAAAAQNITVSGALEREIKATGSPAASVIVISGEATVLVIGDFVLPIGIEITMQDHAIAKQVNVQGLENG